MTLISVHDEPPPELARYELCANGKVKMVVLNPNAADLAAEPMAGLNYRPMDEAGNPIGALRRVMPSEGQEFFRALLQQGARVTYYGYLIEYA